MTGGSGSLARFRGWLKGVGQSHAYLSNPVSIAYLSGFRTNPGERTMALVVTADRALLLVPALEAEAARAAAPDTEVVAWRDGEDPHRLLQPLLDAVDVLAVEKDALSLARAELLRATFGAPTLVDAGSAIAELRLVKSKAELELLAEAARLSDQVTEQALAGFRPGLSELDVAASIAGRVAAGGARLSFETIVQSGPNSALPHLRPSGRRLQAGDLVLLDLGAAVAGYHGDITRMAVIGEPTARQREVHEAVLQANTAAVAAIRPGVPAGEVDEAARAVLRSAGLADFFIHRVGHGLGLEGHEAPSLDPGSDLVLAEGMVVTIEPGAYIPGWGGVRVEDAVVVERGGARLLTNADRSLRVVATA